MTDQKLTAFYEKAITVISEGIEIHEFTRMTYEIFNIPLIIVDEGYQLIAYANDGFFVDPYWEAIVRTGRPSDHTIVSCYLKEGYLDAITQSKGAIYVNWGVSMNYPQTCAAIRVDDQLEGFVSLLFLDNGMKEFSLQLNTVLGKLYAILLQTNKLYKKRSQKTIREIFARTLFYIKNDSETLNLADYRPFLDVKPAFMIFVARSVRDNEMVLEHIRGRIRSYRQDIIYLHQNRLLYMFLYGIREKEEAASLSQLEDFLSGYELRVGCSGVFTELEKRAVYIQQAEYALNTGFVLHPDKSLYRYADYYMQSLLLQSSKTLCPENAVPAEILSLCRFDRQFQTDYARTLEIYLYERNNLNKAASSLHLHRNTLKYRLDKIEDIIQVSPDDPEMAQRLQLGFAVMRLMR